MHICACGDGGWPKGKITGKINGKTKCKTKCKTMIRKHFGS